MLHRLKSRQPSALIFCTRPPEPSTSFPRPWRRRRCPSPALQICGASSRRCLSCPVATFWCHLISGLGSSTKSDRHVLTQSAATDWAPQQPTRSPPPDRPACPWRLDGRGCAHRPAQRRGCGPGARRPSQCVRHQSERRSTGRARSRRADRPASLPDPAPPPGTTKRSRPRIVVEGGRGRGRAAAALRIMGWPVAAAYCASCQI